MCCAILSGLRLLLFFVRLILFIAAVVVINVVNDLGLHCQVLELQDLVLLEHILLENSFSPTFINLGFHSNSILQSFPETSLVNIIAIVLGKLSFTVGLAIFELAFVHSAIIVNQLAKAIKFSFDEVARVSELARLGHGAVTLYLTVMELTLVLFAVGEGVFAVLARLFVAAPVAFVFASICELHYSESFLFAFNEFAVVEIAVRSCLLYFSMEFVIDPIATDNITIRECQLTLPMLLVIVPHSHVFRIIWSIVNTVALPGDDANELTAIGVRNFMVKSGLRGNTLIVVSAYRGTKSAHGVS